jgi:hypothetical protein
MRKIVLNHSTLVLRSDGILELYTNDDHEYTITCVKENVLAFGELTGKQKAPVLIIGGAFTSVTKEAREFMASDESLIYSKAEAFLVKSLPQKMLVNFYIKFNKPLVPTQSFTVKEKAIEWLTTFL